MSTCVPALSRLLVRCAPAVRSAAALHGCSPRTLLVSRPASPGSAAGACRTLDLSQQPTPRRWFTRSHEFAHKRRPKTLIHKTIIVITVSVLTLFMIDVKSCYEMASEYFFR